MKILPRYILGNYVLTFGLAVLICTLVLSFGALKQIIDALARGASAGAVFRIMGLQAPFVLQFSTPISAMFAAWLTISHLSLDGELNAMRACGLSLGQIVAPMLVAAVGVSLVAALVANWIAPMSRYAQRLEYANLSGTDPLELIEEGRFVRDFPGLLVRVGKKSGRQMQDIEIYDFTAPRSRTHVRARAGELEHDREAQRLTIRLRDVRVERTTAASRDRAPRTESWSAVEYPLDVELRDVLRRVGGQKKVSDLTALDLLSAIANLRETYPGLPPRDLSRERQRLLVELNNRMALSVGCFALTVIGVPLGLRSKRRENLFGVGISLAVIFVFYLFIILARELAQQGEWRADLLPWIPVATAQTIGFIALRRG